MEAKRVSMEAIICQALDYACTSGWDSDKQVELAVRVVQRLCPGWSELEAGSVVDWVRIHADQKLRAI